MCDLLNNTNKFLFLKEKYINKIILGDCLKLIAELPDKCIDLVLTDPPYNIGQTNKLTIQKNKIVNNKKAWGSEWDDDMEDSKYKKFIYNILEQIFRVLKVGGSLYCFTAREANGYFYDYACTIGFKYQNNIIIYKKNPLPSFTKKNWRSGFEIAFYVSKGTPATFNFFDQQDMINIFPYSIGKKESLHPTEKPLRIFEKIIKTSSNKNDIVLDVFSGSGTTLVAAQNMERNYIGFEQKAEYCEMARKRLEHIKRELF